jgi:dUTP pyrophosphatase
MTHLRRTNMKIQLDENAIMPDRAHPTDAGLDLFTPVDVVVPAHGYVFVDTGVHVELPAGTRGHICSKSGLNRYCGITADGTVDVGYTGTIGVTLHNDDDEPLEFKRGDKIAQMVVDLILCPPIQVVDKIDGGERGDDGYGSTGKNAKEF